MRATFGRPVPGATGAAPTQPRKAFGAPAAPAQPAAPVQTAVIPPPAAQPIKRPAGRPRTTPVPPVTSEVVQQAEEAGMMPDPGYNEGTSVAAEESEHSHGSGEQFIDIPVSNSALGTMLAAPGYVVGEITSSDYLIPTLKLVHSVGPTSQDFEPGTLLLNYTVPLSAGQPDGSGTTINLTVFKIRKFYMENLPYPAPEGQMPRVFDTQAEMQAAGGHTVWQNNQKPPFSEAAEALIIIECPDCGDSAIQAELEDHFPYQTPSGKLVTAALWRLTGGSYRLAAKPIFSCADMAMRVQGLPFAKWKLGTRRVQVEKNVVWQFVLTRNGVNEAKDVEFFKEMLGA